MTAYTEDQLRQDSQIAKTKGLHICGLPRMCPKCGWRAYHAPTSNWMNRVVCLDCGKKWSE